MGKNMKLVLDWELKAMQILQMLGDITNFDGDWKKYGISDEEKEVIIRKYDSHFEKVRLDDEDQLEQ